MRPRPYQNFLRAYYRHGAYRSVSKTLLGTWAEHFDLGSLTNKLIELRSDLVKTAEFRSLTNYIEFWVSLLSNLNYQVLALKRDFYSRSHAFNLPSRASSGVINSTFFQMYSFFG